MPFKEGETTLTLSLGGVDVCLAPTSPSDDNTARGVISSFKICHNEMLIDLNNFVGTLRIKNTKLEVAANGDVLPMRAESLMETDNFHDNTTSVEAPAASVSGAAAVTPTVAPNHAKDTKDTPPSPLKAAAIAMIAPNLVKDAPSLPPKSKKKSAVGEDDTQQASSLKWQCTFETPATISDLAKAVPHNPKIVTTIRSIMRKNLSAEETASLIQQVGAGMSGFISIDEAESILQDLINSGKIHYSVHSMMVRLCNQPWDVDKTLGSSGLCYFGNFGEKPNSVSAAIGILRINRADEYLHEFHGY